MQTTVTISIDKDQDYEQLLNQMTVMDGPLFTTDAKDMFDTFLDYLPSEYRQHYTCNACRQFINRYGGLVTIDDYGRTTSAIWNMATIPTLFANSIMAMCGVIAKSKVTGVFYSDKSVWGTPVTGEWHHMHVTPPAAIIYRSRTQTPFQAMAEKSEDYAVLGRSLGDYTLEQVETALTVLRANALYRSEKVTGVAEWLHNLMMQLKNTKHQQHRRNIMWRAVATAPVGFCHVRNTMIGTLLDDIASGMDFYAVKSRFDAKMHPLQYQRPQVAPSRGNIEQAEKIVEKLGIANSLRRRFARLDEIPALWRPQQAQESSNNGVFGHLRAKGETKVNGLNLPAQTVTWVKFQRDILPHAESIQFYVRGVDNYIGLVTAADMDAPPILQWDTIEQRNPVSWYLYNNGSSLSRWNLSTGWVDVTAITFKPSMWYGNYDHFGKGVVFILNGAVDRDNNSACLFPETLKSELREVRSTIEAYSNAGQVEGAEHASACGVTLRDKQRWNGHFKVVMNGTIQQYVIDRWE